MLSRGNDSSMWFRAASLLAAVGSEGGNLAEGLLGCTDVLELGIIGIVESEGRFRHDSGVYSAERSDITKCHGRAWVSGSGRGVPGNTQQVE